MKYISAFSDFIEKIMRYLILVIFIVMTAVSIIEVVRRYFMGQSFTWSDELCRYLLVWMGFCGGSLALRNNNLVRFDIGHDKLSEKARAILGLIVYGICMLFTATLCVLSWKWAFSFAAMHQSMMSLPLGMSWVYAPMPLSFAFMVVFCFEKILKIFSKLKTFETASKGA